MFTNITGTLCFANAVLACLGASCLPGRLDRTNPREDRVWQTISRALLRGADGSSWRDDLLRDMGYACAFQEQGDPHEFFLAVAAYALMTDRAAPPPRAAPDPGGSIREHYPHASPSLRSCLVGDSVAQVSCGRCGALFKDFQPTLGPSVHLPASVSSVSLADLWDACLAPEWIDGWRCDTCRTSSQSRRIVRWTRAPSVLAVCVARWDRRGRKDSRDVTISPRLCIGYATFAFRSAVVHRGRDEHGGHYVAVTRDHVYDDDVSTPWHPSRTDRGEIRLPHGWHVYLAFYDRCD